ncbi:MAG: hypothetical protein A2W90_06205 [Bacteroidetes bacterium GWF2_42_66]|nr:MAG: hypothetical protein A2W92_17720 [Bacteroidetes bacterium GWA2_42_15]OFX97051.1 MAG: hypothetical protein A2W89_03970 [Bacteroidetes bacterium GWE2_42_39]OFY46145.1 MAG: hypothetical protein A2W90_06205 [Bacteroidetes bacterium GWF2_42_66]HBL75653.1 hypothetical protein [Prolixibacteraceae bacterium]HCR91131.1 hypothetical protein [Prolixibacteraceae bacterium]
MEKDWVVVFETGQGYQAEIAKEVLENEGITSVILNQRDSTYITFGPIKVYVHQDFEDRANELLKELKN